LSVRGYKGDDLAPLLPTWTSFGVDQYAGYMKAISALQDKIMANSAAIDPDLLATTALAAPEPGTSTAAAIALVYGLDAISHGLTLEDALRRLPELDQEVVDMVRHVYGERIGDTERQRPDDEQSEKAKEDLGGGPSATSRPVPADDIDRQPRPWTMETCPKRHGPAPRQRVAAGEAHGNGRRPTAGCEIAGTPRTGHDPPQTQLSGFPSTCPATRDRKEHR